MNFGKGKYCFLLLLLFVSAEFYAQQSLQYISRDYNQQIDRAVRKYGSDVHTQIQPYATSDLVVEMNPDSVRSNALKGLNDKMFLKDTLEKREFRLRVFPMVNLSSGIDINNLTTTATYETGGGIGIGGDVGKDFSFYADVFAQMGQYPLYVSDYISKNDVNPGMGYARPNGSGFTSYTYNGYLSYSPLKPFNFQLGVGKNFWGDGYRSLWLSDQTTSYPYLKISTTIWKIKYINLFNAMYDIRGSSGDYGQFALKYTSMHLLSYNISKRINVSLWESVVWQNRDNGNYRGFDINYLNPIIFYRPVEFKQGSSDNSLLGLSASVKIGGGTQTYGQIMIDEFLLDSILSGNGWYANKQGFQLGVKSFDIFKIDGLSALAEFNWVRPFSYTHGSSKQNYAHFNEPIAHTLRTNFYDAIVGLKYNRKRFTFDALFIYGVYGRDYPELNTGGDIYRSDLDQPRQTTGNTVGQGITHKLYSQKLRTSYLIDPQIGLQLELSYLFRHQSIEGSPEYSHFIQFGVRTALWNRNRDF